MKKITILGSTGSIGTQTLEVVRNNEDLEVVALTAATNVGLIEKQIREFSPKLAVMWDQEKAKELRDKVADLDVKVAAGMEGLIEAASIEEADIVVAAIVGMIGIRPTIAAIEAGKDIALANKETLVTAGHIIMELAEEKGVHILPVGSEHSAIFQCLQGNQKNRIDKILLTASGGPFRTWTLDQMQNITVEDALHHPNWSMGHKITIDSSTMVNKGLEVMEAKWLFGVELQQIQVLIQPQSIIHSAVQFMDGAVIAQMGTLDMKLPIQYALCYPERRPLAGDRLDFAEIGQISFEKPDLEKFPGLMLALQAAYIGGSMPTAFNAANEKAVDLFLKRKIRYQEIAEVIEESMGAHSYISNPSLEEILDTEMCVHGFIDYKYRS